jgi:hypothetical protein
MKARLLLISLVFLFVKTNIAQTTTTVLNPKGAYAEINLIEQNKMIELLMDTTTRGTAIDSIFKNLKHYNPPVLYAFSTALFVQGEQENGLDWYLYAQLCSLYDANRCADSSARQATIILENNFRPYFQNFISQNKAIYEKGINQAVNLFERIHTDYDYRWINLHGMDAVLSSFDDKSQHPLSAPEESWPGIKLKTIEYFKKINHL